VLETANFVAVAFQVHDAEWLNSSSLRRSPVARLGPDLLAPDLDVDRCAERIVAERGRAICDVLLDQRVLAGLGNVFKSELLFLAGLHPLRPAGSVPIELARELVRRAQSLLQHNVGPAADGGIATYRGLRRTTQHADPGERLYVYGRPNQACRTCATPITTAMLGDPPRRSYFCPTCQGA
jgi:endonuclease-8